jgi:lysophospholipase L1-like esterase
MFRLTHLARVAALGAVIAFTVSCDQTRDVISAPPAPTPNNAIFASYVAIGNSITAGYQSGGINDSTQQQSYARLLANAMNTPFKYPSLAMPGCGAPIANTQTGALVATGVPAGAAQLPCYGRTVAADTNEILNNVAVPGARVLDPSSVSTVASNTLTQIVLKGKSQVQQALRAKPTFASIWIGNNDVLQAGVTGLLTPVANVSPGIVSPQAQFQTSFDSITAPLVAGAPGLKGIMIGVVQVSGIPILSTGDTISKMSATNRAILNQATGKTVTISPECTGSTALVNLPLLIPQIKSGAHPAIIACAKGIYPAPVGDIFVLDPAEQTTLKNAIDGYNAYIASRATALGFAYYDPNPLLAANRATNAIPRLPNFASATATFGTLISLDGIHPAAAAHVLIARGIAAAINAKYTTTLVVP